MPPRDRTQPQYNGQPGVQNKKLNIKWWGWIIIGFCSLMFLGVVLNATGYQTQEQKNSTATAVAAFKPVSTSTVKSSTSAPEQVQALNSNPQVATVAPLPTSTPIPTPTIKPGLVTTTLPGYAVVAAQSKVYDAPEGNLIETTGGRGIVGIDSKTSNGNWYGRQGGGWIESKNITYYQSLDAAQAAIAPPTATALPATAPPVPVAAGVTFTNVQGGRRGGTASVSVKTVPNASCSISYITPHGTASEAQGLTTKTADASGYVYWAWKIGTNTNPGTGSVRVTCNGISASAAITIS